ncbi:MAG: rhomboid family intramembrane serine protease, partial [Verrucomicrobiota bacterium]|nr:rhomboid family intramembrane serine protease [Verrucomicrobiota bacterium]
MIKTRAGILHITFPYSPNSLTAKVIEKYSRCPYFAPVMLEDRSYMRGDAYRPQKSAAIILLIVNVVVFLTQQLAENYLRYPVPQIQQLAEHYTSPVQEYFYLSTHGLQQGYIWQLLTFQFLHAGLFHLFVNLLVIYFFGRTVEESLGRNTFLKIYFLSGTFGGLLQMLLALVIPEYFGGPVIGASAGAMGLMAAFATLFPEQRLTLLVFFIIPVSMKAKFLLWISIGLAVFGIIIPQSSVAHAAHLGGIFVGIIYVIFFVKGNGFSFLKRSFSPRAIRLPRELVRTHSSRSQWHRPQKSVPEELPSAEFISRQVDPILDKISSHGLHSLTENEREILEAARQK